MAKARFPEAKTLSPAKRATVSEHFEATQLLLAARARPDIPNSRLWFRVQGLGTLNPKPEGLTLNPKPSHPPPPPPPKKTFRGSGFRVRLRLGVAAL